jgi:hypothetical protein
MILRALGLELRERLRFCARGAFLISEPLKLLIGDQDHFVGRHHHIESTLYARSSCGPAAGLGLMCLTPSLPRSRLFAFQLKCATSLKARDKIQRCQSKRNLDKYNGIEASYSCACGFLDLLQRIVG